MHQISSAGPSWSQPSAHGLLAGAWILASACAAPEPPSEHAGGSAIELPARFVADRIFLDVATRGGDTLELFTDTGGGLFVLRTAVDRIGWPDTSTLLLSAAAVDSTFPLPLGAPQGLLPVMRPPDGRPMALDFDGMLGQQWFADRVWTFDYAAGKLLLHPQAPAPAADAHTVTLGFRTDSGGKRAVSFPRITVVVDGDTLHLLFDTGATGHLTSTGMDSLRDGAPAARATSFITTEVLERWRSRHPDWRVLAGADDVLPGTRMIEVPRITLAGVEVGPVWFTERPNRNFHEYMSQWMDRRVDGALGGNALRFFRVTVDYPAAVAHFVPVQRTG